MFCLINIHWTTISHLSRALTQLWQKNKKINKKIIASKCFMNYIHDIEANISTSKSFTTMTHKSPHWLWSKSQCIAFFGVIFLVTSRYKNEHIESVAYRRSSSNENFWGKKEVRERAKWKKCGTGEMIDTKNSVEKTNLEKDRKMEKRAKTRPASTAMHYLLRIHCLN